MRSSSSNSRERFAFSPSDVGERTADFLRRRHPERTADNVAADLAPWDIKAETVAAMIQRKTGPGTIMWLALIWAYGPDFLSDVHPAPLGWLKPALREQEIEAIRRDALAIQARLDALE